MATRAKVRTLEKIMNVQIIIKDIVIPTTLNVIELLDDILLLETNCRSEGITSYKDGNGYSEGEDTFDELIIKKKKLTI
ncbi:16125_t:CDS:2 [Gigaspora margarita]|uniref:16125_t:CDS:1 n=1 Tax=Gigaspora margarita TaxID=4874 RepID=A0ABN7VPI3_GIGMA|nr:16125_t:CDS:2 [Gigaspora margarita]